MVTLKACKTASEDGTFIGQSPPGQESGVHSTVCTGMAISGMAKITWERGCLTAEMHV